jgi:UDP-glucose:(heptosyl)LPS alpha-1,3-glucosyltransferase
MAAGLPVITTRQNGAGELITEGVDGFVLESPWAVNAMTERLERLAGDPERRRRMGREAACRAQAFTLDARLEELLAVLTRICPESPQSSSQRSAA